MNEIEIVFLGLVALVISILLLRVFEASEIIEDREVEIATALGTGLLVLVLDECGFHEKIHEQHDIIDENE
jgi:ABC-type branched-subunit amino acid transport system ATPase component